MTPADIGAALPNGFRAVLRLRALGLTLNGFIERGLARHDLLNLELHRHLALQTVTGS